MELGKENKRILKRLLDVKENNMNVADILLYIYQNEVHPSKSELNKIIKERHITEDQALYLWLMDELEMNLEDSNNLSLCNKYFLGNLSKQNIRKYLENPYVKAIKNINIKEKDYSLKVLNYAPYQIFPVNDLSIDQKDYLVEHTPIGFFDEKYEYIALLYHNKIWMSLNPNEINTMEPHINKSKGNILVLGLGLGYFPFMCSLKDEVKSITIIESDQNIINIFNTYLFNMFPNKSKITILKSDAIKYINDNHQYDYIFADLWHDAIDGANLYYDLKKYEKEFSLNISYWLENSFTALKNRICLSILNNEQDDSIESFKVSNDIKKQLLEFDFKELDLLSFFNE